MVGYRELPRARNARWAEVKPSADVPGVRMAVYKQGKFYYARLPGDPYMFGDVVPIDDGKTFVCKTSEHARRLGLV